MVVDKNEDENKKDEGWGGSASVREDELARSVSQFSRNRILRSVLS